MGKLSLFFAHFFPETQETSLAISGWNSRSSYVQSANTKKLYLNVVSLHQIPHTFGALSSSLRFSGRRPQRVQSAPIQLVDGKQIVAPRTRDGDIWIEAGPNASTLVGVCRLLNTKTRITSQIFVC